MAKLLDLLVYSNIWHSLGLSLISYAALLLLNRSFEIFPIVGTFVISFAIYNLNRKTDIKEDTKNFQERVKFTDKHGKMLIDISLLLVVGLLSVSLLLSFTSFIVLISLFFIGIVYSIKCIPTFKGGYFRLKDILLVKNLTVSLTITTGTVFLVFSYPSIPPSIPFTLVLISLFVFGRTLINGITFDLRDIDGDRESNITTLASKLGVTKTKKLLVLINTIITLVILYSIWAGWIPILGVFIALSSLYTYFYIYAFGKPWVDAGFLCQVVADGEYIVIGALAILGKLLCD